MALNNLDRFVAAARNPLSLATLFERDREALPILLQIFATSQHLSDVLIMDSESYDLLRITEGQPVAREPLVNEFRADVLRAGRRRGDGDRGDAPLQTPRDAAHRLRRHHSRPAAGHRDAADFVPGRRDRRSGVGRRHEAHGQSLGRVAAGRGRAGRFVVLALGKLGGVELNYSSDIDLMFLYEARAARTRLAAQPDASISTGWCATS